MRKAGLLVVAMVVTVLVATGLVQAQTAPQGTLDADNLNHQPTSSAVINSMFASGQTFNITRSGKLTGVLLSKDNSPEDLTVEIARVDGGSGYPAVPEDVVASTIRPASIFPPGSNTLQLVDIVFDTPASVVAGEHYALILKARGNPFLPDWYTIGSTGDTFLGGGDTYTGGSASINGVRSGSYPEAGAIHLQRNGRPPMALGDPT